MTIFPEGFEAKIEEIQRLLDEAYDHYFKNSDGHAKSSEGWIQIDLSTYYDRRDNPGGPETPGVKVFSYVLGPSRMHEFMDVDTALAAVKEWHAQEMTYDYSKPWGADL